jgi:NAD(P)-dependent dehydrogenase (short-subunit alcohol dehydrogenase family)
MEIAGKVALVTGAGTGIGRGIAERLAAEGATVVVNDRDEATGRETARAIRDRGYQATFVAADIVDDPAVADLFSEVDRLHGGLDILVNNAGGSAAPFFPHSEIADWSQTLDLNLRATMVCIHYGVRAMQHRGGGAIINISSMGGVGFRPYERPEYGAAKAGVMRLTVSLSSLNESMSIRVNCICPGLVDTPSSQRERAQMSVEERASLPTPLQPADIAEGVIEFLTDDSLAGRVMLWPEDQPRHLIPVDAPY